MQLAIYGCGGFGREVAWLASECTRAETSYEVVCFVDDDTRKHSASSYGLPVLGPLETKDRFPNARLVIAIGSPQTREHLVRRTRAFGFEFESLVHPRTEMSGSVKLGGGIVICAGNILTTGISVCEHVQINLDCTIGHDVIMGDYTTLAPGVHVSGWVHFGKRVYVGTGAVFVHGTEEQPLLIGDDVVIGAGACVTKSIQAGMTVVGNPARPVKK